jgi:uncharacterized protein YgbK (DUF1537 family)
LICWYGDDFTGSAAMTEAMSLAGLPAVLFFDIPSEKQLSGFSNMRGVGIAGNSRAQTPGWMERNLPRYFAALRDIDAPVAVYKICSTLDSSPTVGSIGKALETGLPYLASSWIPFMPAAPPIGRFQAFGNLFACTNGVGYRLDRHPVMSCHPVTPANEADVRVHLARQTGFPIGLIDYLSLREGNAEQTLHRSIAEGPRVMAIDVMDKESLVAAGELIWKHRGARLFALASQGIVYALTAYFRSRGDLEPEAAQLGAGRAERMAIVSGSCSQITAGQIDWARGAGFELIQVDAREALLETTWSAELHRATRAAMASIARGRDPLLFTARGPEDPAVAALFERLDSTGADPATVNEAIGRGLGRILNTLVKDAQIRRVVISGGDTSSFAARELDIYALTFLAPTIPGAALFKAHCEDPTLHGLEIALKGGQMGGVDYFGQIKNGGGSAVRG